MYDVEGDAPPPQGRPRSHSAAAQEGIALLKQGCKVQKYSQNHAKVTLTTFNLSSDERTLSWDREGVGGMLSSLSGKRRSIALADVLEVVVGHEGALFLHDQEQPSQSMQTNLALSLILLPSLPETPEAEGRDGGKPEAKAEERAALDLAFTDDEQFGLWLARLHVETKAGTAWVPARPKRPMARGWPELGAALGAIWR